MPLSRYEQQLLAGIETGLRDDDPAFVARLNLTTADRDRQRRVAWAHGCLWVGMIMTLTGFGLLHDALGAGVLLILYGAGTLMFALLRMWVLRPVNAHQRVRPSSDGNWPAGPW